MIQKATKEDAKTIAKLAVLMWEDHSVADLASEFSKILSQNDALILLKYENDIPVGFAQCQLRYHYVEGTKTSPAGYLEGIFILEKHRNKGYAKALLKKEL